MTAPTTTFGRYHIRTTSYMPPSLFRPPPIFGSHQASIATATFSAATTYGRRNFLAAVTF